jgi:hypothetical protein
MVMKEEESDGRVDSEISPRPPISDAGIASDHVKGPSAPELGFSTSPPINIP